MVLKEVAEMKLGSAMGEVWPGMRKGMLGVKSLVTALIAAGKVVLLLGYATVEQKIFAADCPVLWTPPTTVSELVKEDGTVLLPDTLDLIKVDPETYIPIFFSFTSAKGKVGANLGSGWSVPLLESRMYLSDADRFTVVLPDGRTLSLRRKPASPNHLKGGLATGELSGDMARIHYCNWRFTYRKGVLTEIRTPAGVVLDLVLEGALVKRIQTGGRELVSIERVAGSGMLSSMKVGGNTFRFGYQKRPEFEEIQGQRLISRWGESLSSIHREERAIRAFRYQSENLAEALDPMIILGHVANRKVGWDLNGQILRDGELKVEVEANPAKRLIGVKKTSPGGETSYLRMDGDKGVSEATAPDGTIRRIRSHVTGLLAGRIREIQAITADGITRSRRYSYDDKGKLVRTTLE